jgi:hypothetical protein
MHTASRKISIFLTGFILLAWVAVVPPSLSFAGMNELSDGELSSIHATGFSSFTLLTDSGDPTLSYAKMSFNTMMVSTYTTIDTLKMGYYTKGTLGWDNAWTGVSLGTPSADLVFDGLYIESKFTNVTDSSTRQLDYLRIGTPNLQGDVSANFTSFSGDIGATLNIIRQPLGNKTITTPAGGTVDEAHKGFYLSLDSTGFKFHFGSDAYVH